MKKWITWVLSMAMLMGMAAGTVSAAPKKDFIKKTIPDKTVILTFDDMMLNHLTNAAPELKARGYTGTFYVSELSFEAWGAKNYADGLKKGVYMTWEQVKELSDMGFEIGNHSMNHIDLVSSTSEVIEKEIKEIDNKCAQYGIPKPVTFAYPGLPYNNRLIAALRKYGYLYGRSGNGETYDPLTQSPYKLMAWSLDSADYNGFVKSVQKAKEGQPVVILFHGINSRSIFSKMLDYLEDNDYNVIAMKDLADYVDVAKADAYFSDPSTAGEPTYTAGKTTFSYPGDFSEYIQGYEGFYYMYQKNGDTQRYYADNVGRFMWAMNDTDEFFCRVTPDIMHPGTAASPVVKWVAPADGIVTVTGNVKKSDRVAEDCSFTVSTEKETLAQQKITVKESMSFDLKKISVKKGEGLYFTLSCATAYGGANEVKVDIAFTAKVPAPTTSKTTASTKTTEGTKSTIPTQTTVDTPMSSTQPSGSTENPTSGAGSTAVTTTGTGSADSSTTSTSITSTTPTAETNANTSDTPDGDEPTGVSPFVWVGIGAVTVIAAAGIVWMLVKKR